MEKREEERRERKVDFAQPWLISTIAAGNFLRDKMILEANRK